MTDDLAVMIHGIPAPKGSMKCVAKHAPGHRAQLIEDHRVGQKEWRAQIVKVGIALRRKAGGQITGPVEVCATMTLPRPKSHYRTGRNAHIVRDDAPLWPCIVGSKDDDKLARLLLDGLCDKPAALFADDAQICHLDVWKSYPDTPGCPDRLDQPGAVIRVYRL